MYLFTRITYGGLFLISVIFFPFYISLIVAVVGMFLFANYWEAILGFFISDLIYGLGKNNFLNTYFASFLLAIFLLLLVELLKKKLKFYQK